MMGLCDMFTACANIRFYETALLHHCRNKDLIAILQRIVVRGWRRVALHQLKC